jgi:nitric oxide reductase large subunit
LLLVGVVSQGLNLIEVESIFYGLQGCVTSQSRLIWQLIVKPGVAMQCALLFLARRLCCTNPIRDTLLESSMIAKGFVAQIV